jgi:hypothetical protein
MLFGLLSGARDRDLFLAGDGVDGHPSARTTPLLAAPAPRRGIRPEIGMTAC